MNHDQTKEHYQTALALTKATLLMLSPELGDLNTIQKNASQILDLAGDDPYISENIKLFRNFLQKSKPENYRAELLSRLGKVRKQLATLVNTI